MKPSLFHSLHLIRPLLPSIVLTMGYQTGHPINEKLMYSNPGKIFEVRAGRCCLIMDIDRISDQNSDDPNFISRTSLTKSQLSRVCRIILFESTPNVYIISVRVHCCNAFMGGLVKINQCNLPKFLIKFKMLYSVFDGTNFGRVPGVFCKPLAEYEMHFTFAQFMHFVGSDIRNKRTLQILNFGSMTTLYTWLLYHSSKWGRKSRHCIVSCFGWRKFSMVTDTCSSKGMPSTEMARERTTNPMLEPTHDSLLDKNKGIVEPTFPA